MIENRQKIFDLTTQLYGQKAAELITGLIYERINPVRDQINIPVSQNEASLSEQDVILITYGDQFSDPGHSPLQSLAMFLEKNMQDVIDGVHILPFFPYSSDDGFAVIDYCEVDPTKGTWQDIVALKKKFKLMFDLVANHVSSKSEWFQHFLAGQEPYTEYFMALEAETNLSSVVRPRATPILTPFETANGLQYVWTTFGVDQIDLNYQNPLIFLEMVDVLLYYVSKGANFIRLDAIAYLWKIPGTPCIHLIQTHAVVKLFRAVLDEVAPNVLLITETNVPHAENISYFGRYIPEKKRTDEAQLVYQFPLAPLIMHTFITGNASILTQWVKDLPELSDGTAFFNFTASHDGIGIRPAENLLQPEQVQALVDQTLRHGGRVSYKNNSDGTQSAYELNITWFDAINNAQNANPDLDVARFLASQAIMLSLAGVPGIYVHSMFGSRNCLECVAETGRDRSINREKFQLADIHAALDDPQSLKSRVFNGYRKLLAARKGQKAFHPAAGQKVLTLGQGVFTLLRQADDTNMILCLINVTDETQKIQLPEVQKSTACIDLLSGERFSLVETLTIGLHPYQCRWIRL